MGEAPDRFLRTIVMRRSSGRMALVSPGDEKVIGTVESVTAEWVTVLVPTRIVTLAEAPHHPREGEPTATGQGGASRLCSIALR